MLPVQGICNPGEKGRRNTIQLGAGLQLLAAFCLTEPAVLLGIFSAKFRRVVSESVSRKQFNFLVIYYINTHLKLSQILKYGSRTAEAARAAHGRYATPV